MTDKTNHQKRYQQWLARRREVRPPFELADQIMSQVTELESQRRSIGAWLLVERIERSRAARWAVCSGALAIGCFPFLVLAYVAKLLTF